MGQISSFTKHLAYFLYVPLSGTMDQRWGLELETLTRVALKLDAVTSDLTLDFEIRDSWTIFIFRKCLMNVYIKRKVCAARSHMLEGMTNLLTALEAAVQFRSFGYKTSHNKDQTKEALNAKYVDSSSKT